MADRAQPLGSAGWGGIAVALSVALLILGSAGVVAWRGIGGGALSLADWQALRFTVLQAALSAIASVALAIPVANALSRRSFVGRQALITLLGAPFLLPVIVAVLGFVAVFGRSGPINAALTTLGLAPLSIYGLHGVVLAHVFFNLPLAARLILQGWQDIPPERFRLAASLGMDARATSRALERPMLARVVPGALVLIFTLCTTSFAVAITLGGGPRATTVELAIYQAIRFDFDLSRAALLSTLQLALTGAAALISLRLAGSATFGAGIGRPVERWDGRDAMSRAKDAISIGLVTVFLGAPLLAILVSGLPALSDLPPSVWTAARRSLLVAAGSVLLAVPATLLLALAAQRLRSRGDLIESAALLAIAASPLVLGTGLFLVIWPIADPSRFALVITSLLNAIATLPFALRVLRPALATLEERHGGLADSIGLTGYRRFTLVTLPLLRRPLGFAAGLAAALSAGDLGVIALFADPGTATLPLEIYRLMGAYRQTDAAAAALLLVILSFSLFLIFDLWGRRART